MLTWYIWFLAPYRICSKQSLSQHVTRLIHLLTHPFTGILSAYDVPDTGIGSEDTVVNKTYTKFLLLWSSQESGKRGNKLTRKTYILVARCYSNNQSKEVTVERYSIKHSQDALKYGDIWRKGTENWATQICKGKPFHAEVTTSMEATLWGGTKRATSGMDGEKQRTGNNIRRGY